jgi:hypothetical protein
VGGSGTRRCRMPVQDGAMGDREGGEGATATATATGGNHKGGGEGGRGSGDSVIGGVAVALTRMRMMVAADGTKQQPTP